MLLKLDSNLLINPDFITSVEFKKIRGNDTVVIWVDGRPYNYSGNVDKLLNTINLLNRSDKKQHFAG